MSHHYPIASMITFKKIVKYFKNYLDLDEYVCIFVVTYLLQ